MYKFILDLKQHTLYSVIIFVFCTFDGMNNQLLSQDSLTSIALNSKYGGYLSNQIRIGNSFGFEFQTKYKKLLYSLEYLEFNEDKFVFGKDPLEKQYAISGLIGKSFGDRFFKLQLQSGLTAMHGIVRTDKYLGGGHPWGGGTYDSKKYFAVGIPIRIGLKCVPTRFLAFGVELQGIASTTYSFFVPMFSLELGLLRKKITCKEVQEKLNRQ